MIDGGNKSLSGALGMQLGPAGDEMHHRHAVGAAGDREDEKCKRVKPSEEAFELAIRRLCRSPHRRERCRQPHQEAVIATAKLGAFWRLGIGGSRVGSNRTSRRHPSAQPVERHGKLQQTIGGGRYA
jgi:hypothetical protein